MAQDPDGVYYQSWSAPTSRRRAPARSDRADAAAGGGLPYRKARRNALDFLARFAMLAKASYKVIRRLASDTDVIDIWHATGFAGIWHRHSGSRRFPCGLTSMRCARCGWRCTSRMHQRPRPEILPAALCPDPAGVLLNGATDAPALPWTRRPGIPGQDPVRPARRRGPRRGPARGSLPGPALPGEERTPMRDLHFVHRFHRPEIPDGSTIVLLHPAPAAPRST